MSRLQLRPEFHRVVRALRLTQIGSGVLALRPLRRTLAGGTRYRVRYAESLLMADEIFAREVYRAPFDGREVRTFVDLGSNVGYFTCYAMECIGRSDAARARRRAARGRAQDRRGGLRARGAGHDPGAPLAYELGRARVAQVDHGARALDATLARAGLRFVRTVSEDPHCGVAFYARDTRLADG